MYLVEKARKSSLTWFDHVQSMNISRFTDILLRAGVGQIKDRERPQRLYTTLT